MSSDIEPRALAARRRRQIHALRTRVATIGVASFLALWAGLFVQLATGHDPGLNDAVPTAVVQSADPAATDTSSHGWPDGSALAPAGATSDDGDVMTRQS